MKLTYDLEGIGWATVYLKINDKEEYFNPSYFSEALIDLLDSVMILMPEFTPNDEIKETSSFEWEQEPAIAIWTLKKLGKEQLEISIRLYKDGTKKLNERDLGETLIEEQCNRNDLINEIVDSLDQLVKKYGLVGYRENWYRGDFPIGRYLKLKNYVLSGQTINYELINEGEHNEYRKTSLRTEMNILTELLK